MTVQKSVVQKKHVLLITNYYMCIILINDCENISWLNIGLIELNCLYVYNPFDIHYFIYLYLSFFH